MQGKKIQPISFWIQGQTIQANSLYCFVILDDNYSCKLEYHLQNESVDQLGNEIIKVLQTGNLTINGADYIAYNTSPNGNDYIYTWSGQQLNITYIP
jgi:hypothetical protein